MSAFGGPLKGDTLFGQLCWAARNRWGEERLRGLLEGYTAGKPFAVCSDAFPAGHIPRPALPLHRYAAVADADRKAIKRRHWLPVDATIVPFGDWLRHCRTDAEVLAALGAPEQSALRQRNAQPHNSIDRRTGTTGGAEFAPYTMGQDWFGPAVRLDCWVLHDPARLSQPELVRLLEDIGHSGYGRDASIGLGKFIVEGVSAEPLPCQPESNACVTLAPCAPQGGGFDAARSFYEVFTRFGRHGDRAVHTGLPFKSPVLLAQTGAVLTPRVMPACGMVGSGVGKERLSRAIPETVQQGYAPFVGVHFREVEQ
jgi:CRISPR-associated protein Csm4